MFNGGNVSVSEIFVCLFFFPATVLYIIYEFDIIFITRDALFLFLELKTYLGFKLSVQYLELGKLAT